MSIALWVLQVLLAAEFLFHSWIMVFPPITYQNLADDVAALTVQTNHKSKEV